MKKARFSIFSLLPLWMSFGSVAAFDESKICYILDAILFIYGVVLTVLYCRMKKDGAEGVYEGLAPRTEDTYETIQMNKTKA